MYPTAYNTVHTGKVQYKITVVAVTNRSVIDDLSNYGTACLEVVKDAVVCVLCAVTESPYNSSAIFSRAVCSP